VTAVKDRGKAMAAASTSWLTPVEEYVPRCTVDPQRWTTTQPDAQAVALCVACPRRGWCAREAYRVTGVQGLWAGVVVPESGQRAREFALRRLRVLAERGGYQVVPRRRGRPRGSRN